MTNWFLNTYWGIRSWITGESRWHFVEIKVAPNPDPNRVAKKTAEILMDLSKGAKTDA